MTVGQARALLASTALDIGAAGFDVESGYGIVVAPEPGGWMPFVACLALLQRLHRRRVDVRDG